ncbi:MAG: DUF488 domain-containing protein [Phycisphaeraceae bacterium]
MTTQPIQLFTIGFAGKSAERFFTILAEAKVRRVLDVRLYNSSQLAGYTKRGDLTYFLKTIIGADYSHPSGFAPTKDLLDGYHKGRVSWAEYEQQYHAILEHRRPHLQLKPDMIDHGCMLCAEPTADQCHRRLAAEYLQRIWPDLIVTHL